ncbi:MAG: stage III sporulation protein AF [Clostridia bacterium]|nr:stage III sporulation protein AF [Clostridia bacterium]
MDFLHQYISGIVTACVLAILLENILPETHHKKYINVTIGLVVMLIIIKPLTGIGELNHVFIMPETVIDDEDLSININRNNVTKEFKKRLSQRLSEEVLNKSKKKTEILVLVSTNDNGEITGIEKIVVYPLDEEIKNIIAKTAGVTPDIVEEKK